MSPSARKRLAALCIIAVLGTSAATLSGCGKDKEQEPTANTATSSVEETSVTPEKPEKEVKEEKEDTGFRDDAVYHNNKKFSYDYGGGTITVGMDKGPDDKYIYLNINCSEAKDQNEIGYYIETDRGNLEYGIESDNLNCDVGYNEKETNFAIIDRLYSNVVPVRYVDEDNYGIRWSDDMLEDDTNSGTSIALRAVNLKTGALVALCDAVIEYDEENNSYSLTALKSSDVKDNKELDDESRANLVKKAAEFASERLHVDISDLNNSRAVVDKHNGTYFSKFMDEDDSVLLYKDYTTCADTYVVNIPSSEYGFVSVYFAPQTQLIGLTSPTEPGKTDLKLQLYGYDPVRPFNWETIIAPDGFLA